MNEQQLISELRNALQATVFTEQIIDGQMTRMSKLVIADESERILLTNRLVELLNTVIVQ